MIKEAYKEGFLSICEKNSISKDQIFDLVKIATDPFSEIIGTVGKGIIGLHKVAPPWLATGGLALGGLSYLLNRQLSADKEEYEKRKKKINKMIKLKKELSGEINV